MFSRCLLWRQRQKGKPREKPKTVGNPWINEVPAVTTNGLVGMPSSPRTVVVGRWVGGPGRGRGTWRRLDAMTDGDLVHNRGDGSSILTCKWGLLIPY